MLRLEPLDGGLLTPGWGELAEAAGTPFATPAWAAAWWQHFAAGEMVLLGARRGDGTLAAILPLHRVRRGPMRLLRFLGHGPGDELGPVCAADDRPAALAALRRSFDAGELRADVLLAERIPGGASTEEAFGGLVFQREANPAVALDGLDWDAFLAARSANFRQQVRRRERGLHAAHDVALRLSADPSTIAADLETVFALHEARWGGEGSGALSSAQAAFHRSFATAAAERGWLRLWVLEINGNAVAGWYGLRFASCDWYYQSGRDPAWDRWSVGFVLLMHTIRCALEDGMQEYKLLRGGEAYKNRLATHDHSLVTTVAAHGLGARSALALAAAVGLSRPRVRQHLQRAGLGRASRG